MTGEWIKLSYLVIGGSIGLIHGWVQKVCEVKVMEQFRVSNVVL